MKFYKILPAIGLTIALYSCNTAIEDNTAPQKDAMIFGVESIAKTRVIYGETDHENDEPIKASFERADADGNGGDRIGLYAFYNNFYYFYTEYNSFAESVLFTNNELKINKDGNVEYSPLKTWTFSTLYGTAPNTIDCVAYYPFRGGYNPDYVVMDHDNTGRATLVYNYKGSTTVNADKDFMTAYYKYSTPNSGDFRDYMLNSLTEDKIPLSFTRQMASVDMKVTKHNDCGDITVTGFTIYFNADTRCEIKPSLGGDDSYPVTQSPAAAWTLKEDLQYTVTGLNAELKNTNWVLEPEGGYEYVADRLLKNSGMLFFPPNTVFDRIEFTLKDIAKPYVWHPHVATIEANKHYSLNLELDPQRDN